MNGSLSRGPAILLGLAMLLGLGLTTTGLFAVGNRQWLWSDTFHVRAGFGQVPGVAAQPRADRPARPGQQRPARCPRRRGHARQTGQGPGSLRRPADAVATEPGYHGLDSAGRRRPQEAAGGARLRGRPAWLAGPA